ncbi:MAG TPA: ABC transporter substrate-binding protein [Geminicoccaceae bacterium]|nr:ABC transporter substrate-binding protein [Geminicoccaceae bacterium]
MRRLRLAATALAIILPAAAGAADLRVGVSQDIVTLDPANHRSRVTESAVHNIYDAVVTRTDSMQVVPEIAESFTQIDEVTWEARIRPGITFHDGSPLTAEDVAFTFDRLTKDGAMDGQTSPRKSLVGPVADTEVVDELTVRFKLSSPWPIFKAYLPFNQVVSKAFVTKVGTEGMATRAMGSGPFKLAEWRRGDSLILERYDGYYGGAADIPPVGPAKVDRVIFKLIPEPASRVAALLAGEVDLIDELPHHAIGQLDADPGTKVLKTNGTRSFFIDFNTTRPPFDDVRVRQAANHAVDRQLIIDRILNGLAVPLATLISPDSYGYNPDLQPYSYDVDKAKALLAEAGHPDGIDVTLDVDNAFKEQAEAVAALLARAGIRAKVQLWERTALTDLWKQPGHDRQMNFRSWGDGALDPVGIFVPVLKTRDRGNLSGYSNAEVDRLLTEADTELDVDKRAGMYREAQAIIHEEAPLLYLWLPQDVYGASERLQGWQPSPRGIIKLHDASIAG